MTAAHGRRFPYRVAVTPVIVVRRTPRGRLVPLRRDGSGTPGAAAGAEAEPRQGGGASAVRHSGRCSGPPKSGLVKSGLLKLGRGPVAEPPSGLLKPGRL